MDRTLEGPLDAEGIVAEVPRARPISANVMWLELALSPWRHVGDRALERRALHLHVELDLDETDAWLTALDPGHFVRVESVDASPAASGGAVFVPSGARLTKGPRPERWPDD